MAASAAIVDLLPQEWDELRALHGPIDKLDLMDWVMARQLGFTISNADGEVVMLIGADWLRSGVIRTWSLSTTRWPAHVKTVTRDVRRMLNIMIDNMAVHRIEIMSLATRTDAHRWFERLGFECEGTLRRYGIDARDFKLFSRVH
ncbi:MAG: hypothetical protein ACR2RB_13715 [Gammaproteobacteria bacterium]